MTPRTAPRPLGRLALVAALLTLASALALNVVGAADYVERVGPVWFSIAGSALALLAIVFNARTSSPAAAPATDIGVRRPSRHRWLAVAAVAATVLLLPAAVLVVFDVLRIVGAIPLPVDWLSAVVSFCAATVIGLLWAWVRPLRDACGHPLPTPRWMAWVGIAAAALYPALKTYWLLGGSWLRPAGLASQLDMAYLAPVLLVAAGALATIVALRWWYRPAPRFAHPAAVVGGLTLAGLGVAGIHATFTQPSSEGPLLGVLVYGGWLIWGLTTLSVAARLGPNGD